MIGHDGFEYCILSYLESPVSAEDAAAHPERLRQLIDGAEAAFREGNHLALFQAIDLCGELQIPIPPWAAEAFKAGLQAYTSAEARTLDEAFGVSLHRGKHADAEQEFRKWGMVAWAAVFDRHKAGQPICPDLFETVAEDLPLPASRIRQYYYRMDKFIKANIGEDGPGLLPHP